MTGKTGGLGRLLRAGGGWLAIVVAVAAGAAVVPTAGAIGGVRGQAAGTMSTVAGAVGGPGWATKVAVAPCGVTAAGGSVYVAAGATVRKVSPAGWLTTPVGTGSTGPLGDRGAADRASLDGTCGIAVDRFGNRVIADTSHQRVRVVAASSGTFYGKAMTAGHIYTVAGTGTSGFSGDGGPGSRAELYYPGGVAVDGAGNLLIADTYNQRIRVVAAATGTFYGKAMTAGHIYTVAGTGTSGFSGDGGPATSAQLAYPEGVEVDGAGNLLVADLNNGRIRVVAARTGTYYGQAMTAADIYTVAGTGSNGSSGDGGPATKAAIGGPYEATVDGAGNLLIADAFNNRVRVVAARTGTFYGQGMTAGDIYTVAGGGAGGLGDGGPATQATLNWPQGVAVDGAGNLLIADADNNRVRIVAAATGTFYGQAMTAGDIYTVAGNGTAGLSGNGGPATRAQLDYPAATLRDRAGNLLIADYRDGRIRVVAASSGTFYGQAMTAGHIYTAVGGGTHGLGDGGPATHAQLGFPSEMALDGAGNLLIADAGDGRIRVVAAATGTYYGKAMTAEHIYTVAGGGTHGVGNGRLATRAELRFPEGVAVDGAGNLVIADFDGNRIRVVAASTGTFYGKAMTAEHIYTVAGNGNGGFSGDGGPASQAKVWAPEGVAVDSAGNLVIADFNNERVRLVAASTGTYYGQAMTAGDIYTVAGGGTSGLGDGGPATHAELSGPRAVTVDSSGNLLIADSYNNAIRVVAARTGTYYGQAMTAGDIYTVAGNGKGGYSGDGGPATHAELSQPWGVTVDSAGNLLIADTANGRVREVAG